MKIPKKWVENAKVIPMMIGFILILLLWDYVIVTAIIVGTILYSLAFFVSLAKDVFSRPIDPKTLTPEKRILAQIRREPDELHWRILGKKFLFGLGVVAFYVAFYVVGLFLLSALVGEGRSR